MNSPTKAPDLSKEELEAIEILTQYGVDFPAVYIGRARPYLNVGHYDSKQPESVLPCTKPAQVIIDYVMELIKFDADQKAYLERRSREKNLNELLNIIAETSNDPLLHELKDSLRQLVEIERVNAAIKAPAGTFKFTLYPDKIGKEGAYVGRVRIGGKQFRITARPGNNFINVQLKVE